MDKWKICPKCDKDHTKSGKFCSRSCANSREISLETKEKTRKTLQKRYENLSSEEKEKYKFKFTKKMIDARNNQQAEFRKNTETHLLGHDSIRRKLLEEQDYCCNNCKNSYWLGNVLILELEHKNGNNKDNSRENLEMLCPNCHSFTPFWRGRYPNSKTSKYDKMIKQRALVKSNGQTLT